MQRRTREINIQTQINLIGPLNNAHTLFLGTDKATSQKQLILKKINFGNQFNQQAAVQNTMLKKLYGNNLLSITKPQCYGFFDNSLFLCSQAHPLSLETIILHHKRIGSSIHPTIIYSFGWKLYDIINKIKNSGSDLFHRNLKPSNIFYHIIKEEIEWRIDEWGLYTNYKSEFYSKQIQAITKNKSSHSFTKDYFEGDLYSLGIILLQMITLSPIQVIKNNITLQKSIDSIPEIKNAFNIYGSEIIEFIKQLLKPKDNIKEIYHNFKDYPPEFTPLPDYSQISLSFEDFQRMTKGALFERTLQSLKTHFEEKQIKCESVFDYMKKFDPQYYYYVTNFQEMELFLAQYNVRYDQKQLYQLCFFMRINSTMNYMEILKRVLPTKNILQAVIKRAFEFYSNKKEFFDNQTSRRQYWKAEDIKVFMLRFGINIEESAIIEVVKVWSGQNSRNSLNYNEFNKNFKGFGNQGTTRTQRTNRSQANEHSLGDMLKQLKENVPENNLVKFFRSFDKKLRWIVGPSIDDEIKKYVKVPAKAFKELCQQMWSIAGISEGNTKILRYIVLLKVKKIYEYTQLFRLILTQKINDSNRSQFYQEYQKQGRGEERGWTYLSLNEFNQRQELQFDERQLKLLFGELDEDKSGIINEKELIYRLTGLKEFDLQFLVSKVKDASRRTDLFQLFVQHDLDKDLYLGTLAQLVSVFNEIQVTLPPNHYQILFNDYSRSQKFEFMVFLRFFMNIEDIFLKACRFVVSYYYKSDFEKFFKIGIKNNRTKWNKESLNLVNEQLVLGFTSNQMGKIWQQFDEHKDGSLTKKQIARIFNFRVDTEEEKQDLLGLDSNIKIQEEPKVKTKFDKSMPSISKNTISSGGGQNKTKTEKQILTEEFEKNQVVSKLKQKKYKEVTEIFVKKSQYNASLKIDDFIDCLEKLNIKCSRNTVIKNTQKFQFWEGKATYINFAQLMIFMCQFLQEQQEIPTKVDIFLVIMKDLISNNKLTTNDIFKKCKRSNQMKLSDFQYFFKNLCNVEIYYDDIKDCWKYWGEPEYLTPEDFQNLCSSEDKFIPSPTQMAKQFSFRKEETSEQNRGNLISEKQRKMTSQRSRKSSRDSKNQDVPRFAEKKNSYKDQIKMKDESKTKDNEVKQRKVQQKNRFESFEERRNQEKKRQSKQQGGQSKYPPRISLEVNTKKQEKNMTGLTKQEVTAKFEKKIEEKGFYQLAQLFKKSNTITVKKFTQFLREQFEFSESQAEKLAEVLHYFGKIQIETVKKYMKKTQKKISKDESPKKKQEVHLKLPKSEKQKPIPVQITNPKKVRLNAPLIKEHIKLLIVSFRKNHDVSHLQSQFFDGKDRIKRDQFISKCQDINSSISTKMYDKIFEIMKPINDEVTFQSFRYFFDFQESLQMEQTYLPQNIEKQIKAAFQKADNDKSGFIELQQIEALLNTLGLNESQKQIQNYFQKIDKNFDKKISFPEFRRFVEEYILPYINDFDEDYDSLKEILQMNDIFQTGSLSSSIIGSAIKKYGVQLSENQVLTLNRYLGNESSEIQINNLLYFIQYPCQRDFSSMVKSVLYKIRWKKKISFSDIQKIFQKISNCFVISYTSSIIKKLILIPSAFITPELHESRYFYNDFSFKNYQKIEQNSPNLVSEIKQNDLVVQLKLLQAIGIPIPQNSSVKSTILKRSLNITFYDTSMENAQYCVCRLDADWDSDVEDQWIFDKNNQRIFVKISNYESRKYDKLLLLFQFVITLVDGSRSLQVSCGSASLPAKQLLSIDSKSNRKLKIIAGIPNKSKDIDRMSVSKRKGWRTIVGGSEVDSQFQLQIVPQTKFKQKIEMLAALPEKLIINRKAIHLYWTFRQYFASKCIDGKKINPDFGQHFLVKTFLLALDIPDVSTSLYKFWKDRVQPKIENIGQGKKIFHVLVYELWHIIHSKEFELLPSYPSKCSLVNKNLFNQRSKMLAQVFGNIQAWISTGVNKDYKRKKQYGYEFRPLKVEKFDTNKNRAIIKQMAEAFRR